MSNLHRVHEGPGQGAGPTLPRAVERGAAARADRAHRRDHRVQDPGQGLGTQTRQAGLSEYWRVVTKHLTQMDHHCSNLENIYIEISRYSKGIIFRSGRISSVYIVSKWVVVTLLSKLENFECVGMCCVRVLEC